VLLSGNGTVDRTATEAVSTVVTSLVLL